MVILLIADHSLAEELKDASHVLPRAMASTAIVNYITGFVATITLMSNLGDVEKLLADPSGQAWVVVIYRATGSKAATLVLIAVLIALVGVLYWHICHKIEVADLGVQYFFCAVNQVTCSSRQVFA